MSSVDRRAVNLAQLLSQTAERLPDATALISGSQRLTWSELDLAVGGLAEELRARGVLPGDCVMVHSPNHIEFVQAMFAVWRAGAVLAPTNSRLTPAEVVSLAEVCEPAIVICHGEYAEHWAALQDARKIAGGVLWIGADASTPDAVARLAPSRADNAVVRVGDPCWFFFTSGTSGRPKAAVLTHDQMGFVVTNHLCDLMPGTTDEDVSLVVAPLSHGAGIHLLPQIARGATTILTTSGRLDGAEVWELVEQERVSNIFTVPTILKLLVEHPSVERRDHSSLRYVIYAGAPIYTTDQMRARRVLGDVLVQYYGLGEVTGNITVLPPDDHDHRGNLGFEIGTCGYPRTGMHVSIQDDDGVELLPGEQGEICVAGPAVFPGYHRNPEANAAAFRDGWFRTGDVGTLDNSGYLYVTGRASDMYISGGSNVHPREIEEELLHHPDIKEVAVLGMKDPLWGELGVAVFVAEGTTSLDGEDLQGWLGNRIARYKQPRHYVAVQELPKSAYGKIVKREIREMLVAQGWPPARDRARE